MWRGWGDVAIGNAHGCGVAVGMWQLAVLMGVAYSLAGCVVAQLIGSGGVAQSAVL